VPVHLLKLRPDGMFSNVNEVVQQYHLAVLAGYRFGIDWSNSCYRDPERRGDPWSYYFEDVFDTGGPPAADSPPLPRGVKVACTRDNLITPRLVDGQCDPLLLPRDRKMAGETLSRAIRLKPGIAQHIRDIRANLAGAELIGVHIRGEGRTDGGTLRLRAAAGAVGRVPFALYFNAVDAALAQRPAAAVLVCSDSCMVIAAARQRYGQRLVVYQAQRSQFGEMHAGHPQNRGMTFEPWRLGLDVIVEAHLLAGADCFVHGNSNLANYVLCRAPDLSSHYVYQAFDHAPARN